MSDPCPPDVARDYARTAALMVRAALAGESSVRVPSLRGIEDIDPMDLHRAAIHVVAEEIGGTDPEAWRQCFVLFLSACGDRFLEVSDGGL